MRKMPRPMANSPVSTSSFHQLSLAKMLQAFWADASSGIRPAPSRNTPNTRKTTPMWSIPILVTWKKEATCWLPPHGDASRRMTQQQATCFYCFSMRDISRRLLSSRRCCVAHSGAGVSAWWIRAANAFPHSPCSVSSSGVRGLAFGHRGVCADV